jgi:hypothetical protein
VREQMVIRMPVGHELLVLLLSLLFGATVVMSRASSPASAALPVAVLSLAALGLVALSWLRVVVVADPQGMLVRNFLETRRYAWGEVEEVRTSSELVYSMLHVVLRHNGELFPLHATRRLWPSQRDDAKLDRQAADLRAWIERSRRSAMHADNEDL